MCDRGASDWHVWLVNLGFKRGKENLEINNMKSMRTDRFGSHIIPVVGVSADHLRQHQHADVRSLHRTDSRVCALIGSCTDLV